MPDDRSQEGPVLFAFDGSEHARAAIELTGRELLTPRAAIVLTVWQSLESIPFWGAPMAAMPPEAAKEAEREARETADAGVALAREAGFEAEAMVAEGAPVWERIVGAAEERGAAMIVIGSHGRSGIRYVAMGSVATAVAQHASIPVLVCRLPSS